MEEKSLVKHLGEMSEGLIPVSMYTGYGDAEIITFIDSKGHELEYLTDTISKNALHGFENGFAKGHLKNRNDKFLLSHARMITGSEAEMDALAELATFFYEHPQQLLKAQDSLVFFGNNSFEFMLDVVRYKLLSNSSKLIKEGKLEEAKKAVVPGSIPMSANGFKLAVTQNFENLKNDGFLDSKNQLKLAQEYLKEGINKDFDESITVIAINYCVYNKYLEAMKVELSNYASKNQKSYKKFTSIDPTKYDYSMLDDSRQKVANDISTLESLNEEILSDKAKVSEYYEELRNIKRAASSLKQKIDTNQIFNYNDMKGSLLEMLENLASIKLRQLEPNANKLIQFIETKLNPNYNPLHNKIKSTHEIVKAIQQSHLNME